MITAIQTVPNVVTVNSLTTLGQLSQVIQGGSPSPTIPSVIVTLGYSPPTPLTYSAAGQFESLLQIAGTSRDALSSATTALGGVNTDAMAETLTAANSAPPPNNLLLANAYLGTDATGNGSTPVGTVIATPTTAVAVPAASIDLTAESTATTAIVAAAVASAATDSALAGTVASTASEATLAEIVNATPATVPATSITPSTATTTAALTPAATVPATPATAVPATSATAANIPAATPAASATTAPAPPVATQATSINPAATDAAALAQSNIAGNPAYASMASALYVSAMIYRSQLAAATPTNATGSPPVVAVRAVTAVTSEPKGSHR